MARQIKKGNTANPQPNDKQEVEISGCVLLFNDSWHTFGQVSEQLVKAIQCNKKHAQLLTWVVHTQGKALVFSGDIQQCVNVSGTLEEIDLRTRIEY
jgi:ATP-dependent Clp protease adaptor protein ClpS